MLTWWLSALSGAMVATAAAADIPALTMAEAMDRAAATAPAIRLADATAAESRARLAEARTLSLPTLTVDGGVQIWDAPLDVTFGSSDRSVDCGAAPAPFDAFCAQLSEPIRVRDQVTATAGITVVQPITGLLATRQGAFAAEAGARASEAGLDAAVDEARFRAADAWLQARQAEQQVAIAEAQAESLQARVDATERTWLAGGATRSDLLLAKVALARAEEAVVKTRSLRDLAWSRLGVLVGEPGQAVRPDPPAVEPPLPAPPAGEEALVALATAHRPELSALRRAADSAEALARAESIRRIPELSALGSYIHTEGQGFVIQPDSGFVGAQLSWTAFAWGRNVDAVRAARAAADQARARLDQATDGVRLEIEADLTRLTSALAAFDVAERRVEQAAESLREMDARQRAGAATMTDLLGAQASLVEAESARLTARADAHRAAVALARAIGTDPWNSRTEQP
ncbi:TolC family protein [Myxococcota bacterium]|nr:TolC family protein [Myxococcota bacterium]